jgi:hypothetical protein
MHPRDIVVDARGGRGGAYKDESRIDGDHGKSGLRAKIGQSAWRDGGSFARKRLGPVDNYGGSFGPEA